MEKAGESSISKMMLIVEIWFDVVAEVSRKSNVVVASEQLAEGEE